MNRIPKDIMITRQDLIDWLDKPLSNEDTDLIDYIVNRLENFYKLDEEIARLNKIIDEALRFIKLHDLYHPANEFILLNILQGNDKKVDELTKAIIKAQEKN